MILQSLERKRRESLSKRFSLSVSSFRVLKVDPKVCLSVFRERTREREKERDENEESVFLLNASLCVCVSSFRVLKVDPKVCRERFVLLLRSEEEMCVFFVCVQKESLFQVSTLYKVGTYLGCVSPYKGTLCFLFLCFKVVLTN